MNPRSRGVLADKDDALAAASAPLESAAPVGPPANGLPQAFIASPQYAIAHLESASSTLLNAASPSSHQNEWSTAMARSKRRPASGAQETGKVTFPNLPRP